MLDSVLLNDFLKVLPNLILYKTMSNVSSYSIPNLSLTVWLVLLARGETSCLVCSHIIQFKRFANHQSFDQSALGNSFYVLLFLNK